MMLAERNARVMAEANAAVVKAEADTHLKLEIEKLRRELYGSRSERKARLLQQMELQLEDLEAAATEDELAAEKAVWLPRQWRPRRQPRVRQGWRDC
jgi:transposase